MRSSTRWLLAALLTVATGSTAGAQTVNLFTDTFEIGGDSVLSGFGTSAVNTDMTSPRVSGTTTSSNTFEYYKVFNRADSAFSIADNKFEIAVAANPASAILSADGVSAYDFGLDAGVGLGPAQWGFSVDLQLIADATNNARASIALGNAAGQGIQDRDFGIQLDDDQAGLAAGELGVYFRTDGSNRSGGGDFNGLIGVLPGRIGEAVTLTAQFIDTGDGTPSTFTITAVSGPESFTVTSADILPGETWSFSGIERRFNFDTAPNEGSTYDNLSIFANLVPTAALAANPTTLSSAESAGSILLNWDASFPPAGSTYAITASNPVTFPFADDTGDASFAPGSVEAIMDGGLGDTTFYLQILDGATVVASAQATVTVVDPTSTLTATPAFVVNTDSAATITLDWTADNLPDVATFAITADQPVTFATTDDTGDATFAFGTVDATVDGTLGDTVFTLTLFDEGMNAISTSKVTVVQFDPTSEERYLYLVENTGDIYGFTGVSAGTVPITSATLASAGYLEATHLDYGNYQAFTYDPTSGIVYGINEFGDVVRWPTLADWFANTNAIVPLSAADAGYGAYGLEGGFTTPSIHGASYDPNTGGFYVVYEGNSIDGDVGEYATTIDFITNSGAVVSDSVYGGNILNFYYWGADSPGNFGSATTGANYFQVAGSGRLEGWQSLADYIAAADNRTYESATGFASGFIAGIAVPVPVTGPLEWEITGVTRDGSGNITDATFAFEPEAGASYSILAGQDLSVDLTLVPGFDNVTASPVTVPVPAGFEGFGYFQLKKNL